MARNCFLLSILIFVPVFFFACGNKTEEKKVMGIKGPTYDNTLPGKEGMRNAVAGYTQAIMDAHLSDKHVKFIRKYATEQETKRAFVFINTDRERGLAMAMRLNNTTFDNISTSESFSFVDTSENWDFHNLDIKTSKPVEPVREMRYKLRYIMQREGDKWVITKLKEREPTLVGDYTPPRWSLTGK